MSDEPIHPITLAEFRALDRLAQVPSHVWLAIEKAIELRENEGQERRHERNIAKDAVEQIAAAFRFDPEKVCDEHKLALWADRNGYVPDPKGD